MVFVQSSGEEEGRGKVGIPPSPCAQLLGEQRTVAGGRGWCVCVAGGCVSLYLLLRNFS